MKCKQEGIIAKESRLCRCLFSSDVFAAVIITLRQVERAQKRVIQVDTQIAVFSSKYTSHRERLLKLIILPSSYTSIGPSSINSCRTRVFNSLLVSPLYEF